MPIPTRREAMAAFGSAPILAANFAAEHKKIRIGQIGVGHAHASKLGVYRESADYEVVGVVEPDDKLWKSAENSAAFRGLKRLTREELFAVPDLKAVLVETQVRDLLANAEACVNAGFHVHIDKPAGESLPHFRKILDIAAKKNLLVQMGYMFRYNPGVVHLREFLAKGWLGEVFELHAVMSKVVDPANRLRHAEYPGGMMFELGCHVLDLALGILGKPDRVTPFSRHSSKATDNLADNMLAVFEYPKALATIKATALEVDGGDRRHLVVCGTEGTFHIQPLDNPAARITLNQPRGTYKKGLNEVKYPKYVRYVDDAADMAKIIRGEKKTDFPYEHDLAVQETLLAACGLSTNT